MLPTRLVLLKVLPECCLTTSFKRACPPCRWAVALPVCIAIEAAPAAEEAVGHSCNLPDACHEHSSHLCASCRRSRRSAGGRELPAAGEASLAGHVKPCAEPLPPFCSAAVCCAIHAGGQRPGSEGAGSRQPSRGRSCCCWRRSFCAYGQPMTCTLSTLELRLITCRCAGHAGGAKCRHLRQIRGLPTCGQPAREAASACAPAGLALNPFA